MQGSLLRRMSVHGQHVYGCGFWMFADYSQWFATQYQLFSEADHLGDLGSCGSANLQRTRYRIHRVDCYCISQIFIEQ